MKYLSDFFTGSLSSLGLVVSVDTSGWLSDTFVNECIEGLSVIIGGVLSAIVIKFLRNKFPSFFKKKGYDQRFKKY